MSSQPLDAAYIHREGIRQYLETAVLPHVRPALANLLHRIQEERLKLAAGTDLEDGQFRPRGWQPFCAQEWLAQHLLAQKPSATAALNGPASEQTPLQQQPGRSDS